MSGYSDQDGPINPHDMNDPHSAEVWQLWNELMSHDGLNPETGIMFDFEALEEKFPYAEGQASLLMAEAIYRVEEQNGRVHDPRVVDPKELVHETEVPLLNTEPQLVQDIPTQSELRQEHRAERELVRSELSADGDFSKEDQQALQELREAQKEDRKEVKYGVKAAEASGDVSNQERQDINETIQEQRQERNQAFENIDLSDTLKALQNAQGGQDITGTGGMPNGIQTVSEAGQKKENDGPAPA